VTLKENRTNLVEYQDLKGVECEIQVKTIFDHAWTQIDHWLSYKWDMFEEMEQDFKDRVEDIFVSTANYGCISNGLECLLVPCPKPKI